MINSYLLLALASAVGTFLLLKLVLKFYPSLGWLDNPERYGFKRKPVPYAAGLVFFVVFAVLAVTVLNWDLKLLGVAWGAILLVMTSFVDDRYGLSPWLRLMVQVSVVAIIVATGSFIYGFNLPLIGWIELGEMWGRLATAVWLLVLINVVNWLDGVPGLASGVSGIAFLTLFVLAVFPGIHTLPQEGVAMISLVMGIAALVMTFFSWPKLKLLMGDTGSMFLGLMLGVASVYSGGKVATAALVLFLPIFDAVWTVLRRLYRKRSPLKGDLHHLHHRLQRVGVSSAKLVAVYLLFSVLIAVLTIVLLSTDLKSFMAIILFAILFLVAVTVVYLESRYSARSQGRN